MHFDKQIRLPVGCFCSFKGASSSHLGKTACSFEKTRLL